MKFYRPFNIICLLALLAVSCKKQEIIPPPSDNAPVFMANGTFGGMNIALNAGDDGALMTSYIDKINKVDVYRGALGNDNLKIEMGIFSGNVDMLDPPAPDLSSITKLYFAQQSFEPLLTLSSTQFTNHDLINKITWYINGTPTSSDQLNIYAPGKYEICAHVLFNDGTLKMLCNEAIVGFKSNADFRLNFFVNQEGKFKGWLDPKSAVIQSAKWYQDDVLMNETPSLEFDMTPGLHTMKAVVVFENGVTRTHSVVIDGDLAGRYIEDFTKDTPGTAFKWDYMSMIKLTRNGEVFISGTAPNDDNKIVVDEIKYHGLNADGIPVYILKGKLTANLRNTTTLEVLPLQLNVSFGLAVK